MLSRPPLAWYLTGAITPVVEGKGVNGDMWLQHLLNFLRRSSGEVFNAYGTTALAVGVFVILIPAVVQISQTWNKWKDSSGENRPSWAEFFWVSIRKSRKTELKLVLSAWVGALAFVVVRDIYRDHQGLVARLSRPAPSPPQLEPHTDKTFPKSSAPKNKARTTPTESAPTPGQSDQSAVPQTQLDRLILLNRNLSKGDRDRLAGAFYEFSQSLDYGQNLMYKVSAELGAIGTDGASIANSYQSHITKLRDISPLSKQYAIDFMALRNKWSYYREQTEYVFGDNPDNLGPNSITNAAEGLANYLERWGTIQNKGDQSVLYLLSEGKNDCNSRLLTFSNWDRASKTRLEQMKASIQISSSLNLQTPRTVPATQMF
jgi:hypothetical protein